MCYNQDMNNNDILIRLRYTFDIKDSDMLHIFELGGLTLSLDEFRLIMKKQELDTERDQALSREDLERFLNGFIISQRGVKVDKDGQALPATFELISDALINNVTIKKLKIAMTCTNHDDIKIFLNLHYFLYFSKNMAVVQDFLSDTLLLPLYSKAIPFSRLRKI